MLTQLLGVLCSGVALTVLWRLVRSGSSSASALPLPPGPKPLPVVGNLFDIPTRRLGASFQSINEKYGMPSPTKHRRQDDVLTLYGTGR